MGTGGDLRWRTRALGLWAVGLVLSGIVAAGNLAPDVPSQVLATEVPATTVLATTTSTSQPAMTSTTAPSNTTAVPVPVSTDDEDADAGAGPPSGDGGPTVTIRWDPDELGLGLPPLLPPPTGPPRSNLPPGTVKVTAVDETGAPYQGACIDLWAFPVGNLADHPERARNGLSGADGSFTASFDLTQVPPDWPSVFPPLVAVNVRPCSFPAPFSMDGGILEPGILQEVTVPIVRTAELVGRVTVDGLPVAGQCVTGWTVDPPPADAGGPVVTGPGVFEVHPVQVSRTTSAADGSFTLRGFAPGRVAHLMVSESCDRPAGEIDFVSAGNDYWPTGIVGGSLRGPDVQLGGPASRSTVTAEVQARGDRRADAPFADMPFWGVPTYPATRSADDPVPSCAPDATGGTVWVRAVASGPTVGFALDSDRPAVIVAYAVGPSGGLTEVGCAVAEAGVRRQGGWNLPPGALVLVQGLSGTVVGSFNHHAF